MPVSGRKMTVIKSGHNKKDVFFFSIFYFSECTLEGLQCKFDDKGKTAIKY